MADASYTAFLARKQAVAEPVGRAVDAGEVHPKLHPWQREIVAWAVLFGRDSIFADTGLGKTFMQLEWARLAIEPNPDGRALIVAPLAVCHQTVREAATLGLTVRYAPDGPAVDGPGIWITNYERHAAFDPTRFDAVVLDEASILKNADGKTRRALIGRFASVPFRLTCTATPAPNDPEELLGQAEFLGRGRRAEVLAAYFVHDDAGWRLKGHAREALFAWMATWAMAVRRPSDLGYSDEGYALPPLRVREHLLPVDITPEGQLFATDLGGVGGRAAVRRRTLAARCARAAELVLAEPDEPWVLWCGLNDEADALARLLPGSVNVRGSMSPEEKAEALIGFADGRVRHLITKPSIAGFGMNWQHCARTCFVGLSDSYETYYQAIRRFHRYGQSREVHAHLVLSELEGQIAANVRRKQDAAAAWAADLVAATRAARTLAHSPVENAA